MANIIAMEYNFISQRTPSEIEKNIVNNLRAKRKKHKISQSRLSDKSGVSLGSIKRFEQSGEISLRSLIKIAIALESEDAFTELFTQKAFMSIEEIIDGEN